MYIKDFSELRKKLSNNGVTTEDIEFIENKIKDSKLDEDFKIIHQNEYRSIVDKGLWDVFEKSCKELGIVLSHYIEPER